MRGGFRKTASVRPGGANPNDKTVVINPPGAYLEGGLMKTFHRYPDTSLENFLLSRHILFRIELSLTLAVTNTKLVPTL